MTFCTYLNCCIFGLQVSKELSDEYERLLNPEKALEDSKPLKVKEEPINDLAFTLSEEAEGEMTSAEQAMSTGVLGMSSDRLAAGLEDGHSPHTSGTKDEVFISVSVIEYSSMIKNLSSGITLFYRVHCVSYPLQQIK